MANRSIPLGGYVNLEKCIQKVKENKFKNKNFLWIKML